MEAYAPIFGFLGTCIVSVINFSPVPGSINLWKTKDLSLISHSFFVMCAINTVLWLAMGISTHTMDILRVNIISFVFNTLYLCVFHTVKGDLLLFLPAYIVSMSATLFTFTHYVSGKHITLIAGISSTLTVIAPLEQLRHVYRTKDSKYIDIYIMGLALPCSFCWMMFGVCRKIWALIVPNMLGTVVYSVLVVLFVVYRRPVKGDEDMKLKSGVKEV